MIAAKAAHSQNKARIILSNCCCLFLVFQTQGRPFLPLYCHVSGCTESSLFIIVSLHQHNFLTYNSLLIKMLNNWINNLCGFYLILHSLYFKSASFWGIWDSECELLTQCNNFITLILMIISFSVKGFIFLSDLHSPRL